MMTLQSISNSRSLSQQRVQLHHADVVSIRMIKEMCVDHHDELLRMMHQLAHHDLPHSAQSMQQHLSDVWTKRKQTCQW